VRRKLLSCVARSSPRWLADQAEDIVQTALLRLLPANTDRGGGIQKVSSSYLSRVAYNAVVDEMRRRFRRPEVQPGEEKSLDGNPSGSAGPEEKARAAEIHEALRNCLKRMIRPRRIAVACYLQGYSVPEAAAFTGWSKKKTEHLLRRGLENLRACLAGKGLKP
jgi:RNA polymerase sigma factor (sigma-70 family)